MTTTMPATMVLIAGLCEFGAFIGTATLIYNRASSAARAIKDYNLAQIDNRTMKVEYAFAGQQQAGTNQG